MSYDFQQLSPDDLEILVRDLLQTEWGIVLENFKKGRDRGIDLRYARSQNNLIVQVKHYVKTGFDGLLRDLKSEAAKVAILKPSRYILATSVPLSPGNKQSIVALFGGCLAVPDVLGQEDLNNLLGRHIEIEHRHYKLWLASRAVLDRILNSDLITQTEFQVEKVYATIRRSVRTDAYHAALKILDRDRVAIISGAPGVGKTTLANLLLYAHLEKGWEPVVIRRDIAEGQRLFQRGKGQIFYFDDFMGATFLGDRVAGLPRNEDRVISDFIEMVRASPNARLVLTTREHIFGQAIAASERLRQAGINSHKIMLRIGDYDFAAKAKILYNHLYFSDLPDAYKNALLDSDFYLEIVRHPKFNPRLIEWLSSFTRLRSITADQYRQFVRSLLSDPSEIWLHAYEQQLSDSGRSLLLALYSLGGKAKGAVLRDAFQCVHELRASRWSLGRRPDDWANAMAELANAFIKPIGQTDFEVLDPSVLDLLNAVIRKAPDNAVDLVLGAVDFSQIERVWVLARNAVPEVLALLVKHHSQVTAAIRNQIYKLNRLVNVENAVLWVAWTFAARLAAVLPIADSLKGTEMLDLVTSLSEDMRSNWSQGNIDINDGADALRALEQVAWLPLKAPVLEKELAMVLIWQAQRGCRSDELREIVAILNLDGAENASVVAALRTAFENSRDAIASEIHDCRRSDQFKGLREDFELFASSLGVDVGCELERLEEALLEYSGYEEQRADDMMDEYKDQHREARASEDSVRDMFGSLNGG